MRTLVYIFIIVMLAYSVFASKSIGNALPARELSAEPTDRPTASPRLMISTRRVAGSAASANKPASGLARSSPTRRLFDAIRRVESGGNPRPKPGDGGNSLGPYQIQFDYWCEGGGNPARYRIDAYDRVACERVMVGYWKRYGATTDEQRARMHNGGPSMRGTDGYWQKVKGATK